MNKLISFIAIPLAIIAIIVGISASNKVPDKVMGSTGAQGPRGEQGQTGPQGPQGSAGRDGRDGVTRTVTITQPSSPVLGAVSSPDIMSPYFSYGGVRHWGAQLTSLNAATTTVCTLQSPPATSTLMHAGIKFDVSSTTASIVDIAKSSNTGATTTKIGTTYNIAANVQATIVASTTGSVAGDATLFSPNQFLVINMKGGANSVFSPTGTCNANWISF